MIRLFRPESLFATNNIFASGIISTVNYKAQRFARGSFIPNFDTLRKLSPHPVTLQKALGIRNFVYLGKLSMECLEKLREAAKEQTKPAGLHMALLTSNFLEGASEDSNLEISGPIAWNGVAVHKAGLASTTKGPEDDYLGLHFDDFEGRELKGREEQRQRLCVNLGDSVRGFSFWPIAMNELFDAVGILPAETSRSAEITEAAFQQGWIAEIVTVRLAPGEFYVAPTENILHDGNTLGGASNDLSLTLRANVRIRASSLYEISGYAPMSKELHGLWQSLDD